MKEFIRLLDPHAIAIIVEPLTDDQAHSLYNHLRAKNVHIEDKSKDDADEALHYIVEVTKWIYANIPAPTIAAAEQKGRAATTRSIMSRIKKALDN